MNRQKANGSGAFAEVAAALAAQAAQAGTQEPWRQAITKRTQGRMRPLPFTEVLYAIIPSLSRPSPAEGWALERWRASSPTLGIATAAQ